jgi:hypothetical protein
MKSENRTADHVEQVVLEVHNRLWHLQKIHSEGTDAPNDERLL